MVARLQEKLALRCQQRDEDERTEQRAFESLAIQREEMIHQVLNTQPDLTKECVYACILLSYCLCELSRSELHPPEFIQQL